MKKKCKFNDGIIIKPDGINELDPCIYETIECYKNVDIEIVKCKNCGNIEIWWYRTPDTEKVEIEDFNNG